MDLHLHRHYPIDGSSLSLSYQWMNIILPTDHHHYPTNGSTLSYRRIFIIIILPTDLHYHHPTNGSSSVLSYQWIIINHHFIYGALSSYRWSIINIIILSMEQHHHHIIIVILPMDQNYPTNGSSSLSTSSY
ncbi:hypothetical protein KY285_020771 [Solanum tuberosum]|nr:hypothetical protein KY289_021021 [Solanum tuberosum]KAH0693674.1 hypothetical protein KY285_020771 [Solanum tuberosum]